MAVQAFWPTFGRSDPKIATPPAPEQRGRQIGKMAAVAADGEHRLKLRAEPSTSGDNIISRLGPNDRVVIDQELRSPAGWYYVSDLGTGVQGYIAKPYVAILPDKDPDAKLHRIASGESHYSIIMKYYGPLRRGELTFYGNVLEKFNQEQKRPGISVERTRKQVGYTSMRGDIIPKYQTTVVRKAIAGKQIWIPSKPVAWSYYGKVPTDSLSLAAREFLKRTIGVLIDTGKFLAGLGVGAALQIADMVTGIWDLIKAIVTQGIRKLLSDLIDFAKLLMDKPRQVLHALGDALQREWNKGWYPRGKIIGRVIAEVLVWLLTAGSAGAARMTGWVGKVWKLMQGTKAGRSLEKFGNATRNTAAGRKIAEKLAARRDKKAIAEALELDTKRRAETAKKRLPALPQDVAAAARALGYPTAKLKKLLGYSKQHGVRMWLRPSNQASVIRLMEGAIPKPVFIKMKTVNQWDLLLNRKLRRGDLGKAAFFDPPANIPRPKGMSKADHRKLLDRAEMRRKEHAEYKTELAEMGTRPDQRTSRTAARGSQVRVTDRGIVQVKGSRSDNWATVAGDIDPFQILNADGSYLTKIQYLRHVARMKKAGLIEHGALARWARKDVVDEAMFQKLMAHHRKHEALVELAPDGSMTSVMATHIPGTTSKSGTMVGAGASASGHGGRAVSDE